MKFQKTGKLAKEWCGVTAPLQILRSAAGFYIGTAGDDGPISRESNEYWRTQADAQNALDNNLWTQKENP